ncbi:MAG: OmpA family protein [Bacteroidia bacterium]|nr:OmpA family protein [Bacteroidia bacterium]
MLYFVSRRAGGKGGQDIWYSQLGEDGKWMPAQNLAEINTPYEELSPFIHPNGRILFFASDGYPGFGSYDLYQSELVDGKWSDPKNLGYPINNYQEQIGLFITTDGQKGYYSPEETINEQLASLIYEFDVPQEIQPANKSNYVKGVVYDAQTKQKLNARIELFDLTTDVKQASVTSDPENGSYLLVLSQGSEYALEVNRKGYAFKSLTFNYTESQNLEPLEIDIALDPISKGTTFRLNNIFFDYNQYELEEKSQAELDELVKFMKENPGVQGEIAGHTDNIGNPADNQKLSLNRAKAVYDYLVNAGIVPERLRYQGYGATRPDAPNDSEEGRARNRRIEFEILGLE